MTHVRYFRETVIVWYDDDAAGELRFGGLLLPFRFRYPFEPFRSRAHLALHRAVERDGSAPVTVRIRECRSVTMCATRLTPGSIMLTPYAASPCGSIAAESRTKETLTDEG